jgi:hypothetical protein
MDVEIIALLIYYCNGFVKHHSGNKMESQKDFENKVTKFIHRLPYKLLEKLNLTPDSFIKAQQIYFARVNEK